MVKTDIRACQGEKPGLLVGRRKGAKDAIETSAIACPGTGWGARKSSAPRVSARVSFAAGDLALAGRSKRATCLTGFVSVDYVLPIAPLQQPSSARRHPPQFVLES